MKTWFMDALQTAIWCNNEGARLLISTKSVSEALRSFEAALTMLQEIAMDSSARRENTEEESMINPRGEQIDLLKLGNRIGLRSDHLGVIDHVLLLPKNPKITSRKDLNSFIHWTTTAIIFNYALACHQHGSLTGRDSSLDKATSVYKLAIKMVQGSESDDTMYNVVECSALNNLAHLLYHQCAFDESAYFVSELSTVLFVPGCLQPYLSDDDIESLLMNTILMESPVAAQAA